MTGNASLMFYVSVVFVALYLLYVLFVYNPEKDRIPEAGHHIE